MAFKVNSNSIHEDRPQLERSYVILPNQPQTARVTCFLDASPEDILDAWLDAALIAQQMFVRSVVFPM